MAGGAVAEARIGHVVRRRLDSDAVGLAPEIPCPVVTLQANGEDHRAFEQARVGGAMRRVTGLTAIYSDSGVFVQEWAAFVCVAFQACLFILERGVDQVGPTAHLPGGSVDAVGIVTVGADHEALVNAVLEGL